CGRRGTWRLPRRTRSPCHLGTAGRHYPRGRRLAILVGLESEGARDVDPPGSCSRPPLSSSLRMGRPRRPGFNPTRGIIDGSSTSSWSMMVGRKLYVGNLAYQVSDADLEQLFAGFGIVESAQVIQDRATGRSKGFGFVEMSSEAEAQAAIQGLHNHEVN